MRVSRTDGSFENVSSARAYFEYFREISNGPRKANGKSAGARVRVLSSYRFRPADNTPGSADHGLGPAEAFPAFAEDVPSFSFVSIPGSNVRPSPTDWSPLSAAAAAHFFSRVHKDAVDAREPPGHNEIFSVSFLLRRARTLVRRRPLATIHPGTLRAGVVRVL